MTVVAVSMMRDEADVAYAVVKHMAYQVDHVIVADNMSTDGTYEILRGLESELDNVLVIRDEKPGYYQSMKMTNLGNVAANKFGATWVVPFDADEVWYSRFGPLGAVLDGLSPEVTIARATLFNHYCTALDLAPKPGETPFHTMRWRKREPGKLPKVAVRWDETAVIHQGNHGADVAKPMTLDVLEIRHFPYRSAAHMVRKARNGAEAYRAAPELDAGMGVHWRAYGQIAELHGDEALEDVFRAHFWYLSPTDSDMVEDPAPLNITPAWW